MDDVPNGFGNLFGVLRINQSAGVAIFYRIGNSRLSRSDSRYAEGHRFDNGNSETFEISVLKMLAQHHENMGAFQ